MSALDHVVYDNFVLENKIEDFLTTKVDLNNYITADYSLSENPGMVKKVHVYTATGDVEDCAMGEGNSDTIEVSFDEKEYRVGTTQGRFQYYDEQESTDPMVVETGLKKLADSMTNDLTAKAIGEFKKAGIIEYGCQWTYDNIVDAIAAYPHEEEDGLFLLINKAQKAAFRKNLKDDLKYVEANVRSGYIGTICNVPVVISDAVPAGSAFLGTKEAVTCFIKKGVSTEQERDANTRKNGIYARKVMLVALTDATRVIKLSALSDPRTGYHLVESEPDDWATKYATDYYVFDNENDELVLNDSDEFVANKFYHAD